MSGEPVLDVLRLVVLRRKGPLVECVLGRVRLGRRLDIHERHRGGGTRAALGAAATARAALAAIAERAARAAPVHGALLASRQQFDTLNSSIPVGKQTAVSVQI